MSVFHIYYSEKYYDDEYEYRVITIKYTVDTKKIFTEKEVEDLGIRQSPGWQHIMTWHNGLLLLFKRKLPQ